MFRLKKRKKAAIEMDMLAWWIIGLAVLAIIVVAYFVLKVKGINAIEYFKNLLRLRK